MNELQFIEAIQINYSQKSGVIGICGLSGSGKTTLSRKLQDSFSNRSLAIHFDDFFIVSSSERKSHLREAIKNNDLKKLEYLANPRLHEENPYANPVYWYDWNAIAQALLDLKQGKSVTVESAWNSVTGERDRTVTYEAPNHPYPLYFLDCIFLYQPEISELIDETAMINTEEDLARERKFERDKHRNYGIYTQYKKLTTDLYDIPYLNKHKGRTNYLIEPYI